MDRFSIAVFAFGIIVLTLAASKKHGSKIIGGEPAIDGQIPYQVSIEYRGWIACGGSIIIVNGKQVVLTAAFCGIQDYVPDFTVTAGDINRSNKKGNKQRRNVTRIVRHEKYSLYTKVNNIAIMFLDQPFELNENVKPIDLPKPMQQTQRDVMVSGWGYKFPTDYYLSDVLQWVVLPTVSDEKCKVAYRDIFEIVDHMICAGLDEGGKGHCVFDEGGPVKAVDGDYLAGIVSWSYECAETGYPGIYTEVSYFIDWIENIVALY